MGRLGALWPNNDEAGIALEKIQQRAERLISDQWDSVEKLAEALLTTRTLTATSRSSPARSVPSP